MDPAVLLAAADDDDLPAAERARRERAREQATGIVAYDADTGLKRATFALMGRLFLADLGAATVSELPAASAVFDPRLDPTGTKVAYVSGAELRLASEAGDSLIVADPSPTVTWGSAEFIAAEEMHRTRGFWWAPDGQHLIVQRVDTAPVDTWHIASPVEPWKRPVEVRYPAAGTPNAIVGLAVLSLDGTRVDVDWSQDEFEYLCDVQWRSTGEPIAVVQTRDQRTLVILRIDPSTGAVHELWRIVDAAWTDLVPGCPAFTGPNLTQLVTVECSEDTYRLCVDGEAVTPPGLQIRRVLAADETTITFVASNDPTETHVGRYRQGSIDWITTGRGVHERGDRRRRCCCGYAVDGSSHINVRCHTQRSIGRNASFAGRSAAGAATSRVRCGRRAAVTRRCRSAGRIRRSGKAAGAGRYLRGTRPCAGDPIVGRIQHLTVVGRSGLCCGGGRQSGYSGARAGMGPRGAQRSGVVRHRGPGRCTDRLGRAASLSRPVQGGHPRLVVRRIYRRACGTAAARSVPCGGSRRPRHRLAALRHALHRTFPRRSGDQRPARTSAAMWSDSARAGSSDRC